MNRAGSLTLSRRSKATGTHIKKYEKNIPFDEGVNSLNISNGGGVPSFNFPSA